MREAAAMAKEMGFDQDFGPQVGVRRFCSRALKRIPEKGAGGGRFQTA